MSTTPAPEEASPSGPRRPGRARTPASAKPCLRGSLSAYSNGPTSIVSMPRSENSIRIDFFSHSWTTTSSVAGSTSATRAWPVSSSSMASSTSAAASVSAGESSAAALPQLLDARLQISHGSPYARRSPTSASRSIGWTTATRTCPRRPPRRRGRPG